MEDNVKDEGYQDSNEHPEDLSHGLQRELVSDAAVHCRDGLTFDQGDEGADNNDADACSNEHINEEFQYGFHYPNSDYVIPAANIISFLVSAPLGCGSPLITERQQLRFNCIKAEKCTIWVDIVRLKLYLCHVVLVLTVSLILQHQSRRKAAT
jgi:hypothetical protein